MIRLVDLSEITICHYVFCTAQTVGLYSIIREEIQIDLILRNILS